MDGATSTHYKSMSAMIFAEYLKRIFPNLLSRYYINLNKTFDIFDLELWHGLGMIYLQNHFPTDFMN